MTDPLNKDLQEAYGHFGQDHARLRDKLLTSLLDSEAQPDSHSFSCLHRAAFLV